MLRSRAIRCVGLIAIALTTISCRDVTGPTSTNVTELPRLAPPSKSANSALTDPVATEPPVPTDMILSRWILISGVWMEVEDPADK